jgi:hypothetical protein
MSIYPINCTNGIVVWNNYTFPVQLPLKQFGTYAQLFLGAKGCYGGVDVSYSSPYNEGESFGLLHILILEPNQKVYIDNEGNGLGLTTMNQVSEISNYSFINYQWLDSITIQNETFTVMAYY